MNMVISAVLAVVFAFFAAPAAMAGEQETSAATGMGEAATTMAETKPPRWVAYRTMSILDVDNNDRIAALIAAKRRYGAEATIRDVFGIVMADEANPQAPVWERLKLRLVVLIYLEGGEEVVISFEDGKVVQH